MMEDYPKEKIDTDFDNAIPLFKNSIYHIENCGNM